ncbi:MAG: hypothetical protein NC212_06905 [Staphylococcus sp.]|nr:hypothetical protein [Staphylococcus sp.]
MRKSLSVLLMIFLMVSASVRAQSESATVAGSVKDRKGETLIGVVVKLLDPKGEMLAYAVSTPKGEFTLRFPKSQAKGAKVECSYIGYSTVTLPLPAAGRMEVVMDEAPYELKEVVVRVPPIKSVGDTLTYDVASFKSAADRSIEDIIRKLPGITVDDRGRISYNGEAINRFYIEGLDVVSGRYAIATRNISPDDVQSVNVYENHQPKRVLKDVEFSKNAALNLTLKRKSLLKPIGYVKGGGGVDEDGSAKWLGEAFGMFIAPSFQSLVSLKGNNSGIAYSSETAVLIAEHGMKLAGSPAYEIFPVTPFGSAKIPAMRYYDNRSLSASVSTRIRLGKVTTLGVTADYSDEDNRFSNSQSITYINGDDPAVRLNESVVNNPHLREAKLIFDFEHNSDSKYIKDKFSFTGHFNSNRYSIFNGARTHQRVATDDYNFNNQLDLTWRSSTSVFGFSSIISVGNTPVNRMTVTGDTIPTPLSQTVKGFAFNTLEKAGYMWRLSSHASLGVDGRFNSSYTRLRSLNDWSDTPRNANDIAGYQLETTLEPYFRYVFSSVFSAKLSVPLRMTNIKYDDELTGRDYPTDRFDADWRLSLTYNPMAGVKSSWSVGRTTTLGSIRNYVLNPIYTTYRRSSVPGTGVLGDSHGIYANGSINYRNTIEGFFASLDGLFRRSTSNRLGSVSTSGGQIESTAVNSKNTSDMLTATLNVSKNFRDISTIVAFAANITDNNSHVMRQHLGYRVDATAWGCLLTVTSFPIRNRLSVKVEGKYDRSGQKIDKLGISNSMHDISGSATLSVFPIKAFELSGAFQYYDLDVADGLRKRSVFLKCGARYTARKFEVELNVNNVTNRRSYSYSYFRESDFYAYSFGLRPREIIASLKYSF